MDFSYNENENFLWKTCCPFQYAPICTKWYHLGKLSFETSTNIGHLALKPRTFILDTSFWEDFFKIFALFQVYWFVWLLGHKLGCNAKVLHFLIFFELFKPVSKCDQNGGEVAWPMISRGGILQTSWWISYLMTTCVPRNDFLKK